MQAAPVYICVDVESAGPNPASYALLSIGAALVEDPARSFYVELQPDKPGQTQEAAQIHQLDWAHLVAHGRPAQHALQDFVAWVQAQCGERPPVFVAFNAPFDWMFVNDYLHYYLGSNPFGHRALDIKAVYFGLRGVAWDATSFQAVSAAYGYTDALQHNAEQDARQGAQLFAAILQEIEERHGQPNESGSATHY